MFFAARAVGPWHAARRRTFASTPKALARPATYQPVVARNRPWKRGWRGFAKWAHIPHAETTGRRRLEGGMDQQRSVSCLWQFIHVSTAGGTANFFDSNATPTQWCTAHRHVYEDENEEKQLQLELRKAKARMKKHLKLQARPSNNSIHTRCPDPIPCLV